MPLAAERVPWGIRGSFEGLVLGCMRKSKTKGEPRIHTNERELKGNMQKAI